MSSSIKVLPKHTLDAMLVGLCQPRSKRDVEGGSSGREAKGGECDHDQNGKCCPLTELTMPVITAAVNAKPPLSDNTIGMVVRRLEAASEEKQMQVSQWSVVVVGSEIECSDLHGPPYTILDVFR